MSYNNCPNRCRSYDFSPWVSHFLQNENTMVRLLKRTAFPAGSLYLVRMGSNGFFDVLQFLLADVRIISRSLLDDDGPNDTPDDTDGAYITKRDLLQHTVVAKLRAFF